MSSPKVTVVIAAYKNDIFLRQAIESVLDQALSDFEIIVSDDAASDITQNLVSSINDSRCRYRCNAERLGASGNHLAALSEARGEYISILNHDDIWEKNFLSALIPVMDQYKEIAVGFCDHHVIDSGGNILKEVTEQNSRYWKRAQLSEGLFQPFDKLLDWQSIPMAMGSIFRKSFLDLRLFPPDAGPAYDLWLTYLLCKTRGAAYYKPLRLTRWRVHNDNLSSKNDIDWALGSALCWEAIARDEIMMNEMRWAARKKAALSHCGVARGYLEYGLRVQALKHVFQSLKLAPTFRAVKAFMLCLSLGGVRKG